MSNFSDVLKKEVARIARKELKAELTSLRSLVSAMRSEMSSLKRELKELRTEGRAAARAARVKQINSPAASVATEAPRRGRKPQYSADALLAMRQKLGLTRAQLATVLEVSSLSIYKWESKQSVPRAAQQAKILDMKKLGKRAISRILSERS